MLSCCTGPDNSHKNIFGDKDKTRLLKLNQENINTEETIKN